jgi:hypothetical protein
MTTPDVAGGRAHRTLRRVGVATALVVAFGGAIALGDNRFRTARENDAEQVVAAVKRGDCVAATAAYDRATTGFALPSRRPDIPRGVARSATGCLDLVTAAAAVRAGGQQPDRRACRHLVAATERHDELARAADTLPPLLLACGRSLGAGNPATADLERAVALLSRVRRDHPDSPEARPAERAEAALRAPTFPPGAGRPAPLGTPAAGRTQIQLINLSRDDLVLAVSGTGDGRVVEIEGYHACPAHRDPLAGCDRDDAPTATVTVPPGTYSVLARAAGSDLMVEGGTWRLGSERYLICISAWA